VRVRGRCVQRCAFLKDKLPPLCPFRWVSTPESESTRLHSVVLGLRLIWAQVFPNAFRLWGWKVGAMFVRVTSFLKMLFEVNFKFARVELSMCALQPDSRQFLLPILSPTFANPMFSTVGKVRIFPCKVD
jgi:hypothetical protein